MSNSCRAMEPEILREVFCNSMMRRSIGNWVGAIVLAGLFCAAGVQAQQSVRLNEVLANNLSLTNSDGTITDWIELFNPGPTAADLSDTSLTDGQGLPRRFVFPSGTGIEPAGFLRVRCSSLLGASASNTGFGLDAEGGGVYFYDKPANGGALIDSVSYGVQAINFSIGRIPDGFGEWRLNVPTGALVTAALRSEPLRHCASMSGWRSVRSQITSNSTMVVRPRCRCPVCI